MPSPLVLTCGEPAGIGPEIAAAAWFALRGSVPFFVLGDPDHLRMAARGLPVVSIARPAEAPAALAQGLPVLAHPFPATSRPGQPDPANAAAVVAVIARAVEMVQSGAASALCTAPIHKRALVEGAGFAYPGHTEYLAALAGHGRAVMMLAGPGLRVVPATIHIPLAEVPARLTSALLDETLRITLAALARDFGCARPRVAVAGLNPHAGEGGVLGREEETLIAPVIARLRAEGHDVTGPLPADTMFHPEARARMAAAVCMYHAQALIPLKALFFDAGVNVTLGLPFIRTSPDHGTAFDIAGRGIARPDSMVAALRMAWDMARARTGGAAPGAAS
ncbi:MAG: 4-hydroxythreonine-4-phosphate dehydrogenase PdxA [Rhodobacteraceae bacterium]|nr:4-hydroxythreonine-4-phosphate dehydrogenase PdxA [Paracoccaceae bacterium]